MAWWTASQTACKTPLLDGDRVGSAESFAIEFKVLTCFTLRLCMCVCMCLSACPLWPCLVSENGRFKRTGHLHQVLLKTRIETYMLTLTFRKEIMSRAQPFYCLLGPQVEWHQEKIQIIQESLPTTKWKKMCESRLFFMKANITLCHLANEMTISFRSCHRIVIKDLNMQDFLQICTLPTDWRANHNHVSVCVTTFGDPQFRSQIIIEEEFYDSRTIIGKV